MVLSLTSGDSGNSDLDAFVSGSLVMLGHARHSFRLATDALLTDADTDAAAQDVRQTDIRINQAEEDLRRQLIGHIANGNGNNGDVAAVIGLTRLIKKVERVGDHSKNILELTENGVCLAAVPETDMLLAEREVVSALFDRADELLQIADPDPDLIREYAGRANSVIADCQARIDSYMDSDRPGREVVPLAVYSRFLRRIVANLLGVVRAWAEP